MKENISLKNKENFSLKIRRKGKTVENTNISNGYSFRNEYKNEVEYSYAFCKEN